MSCSKCLDEWLLKIQTCEEQHTLQDSQLTAGPDLLCRRHRRVFLLLLFLSKLRLFISSSYEGQCQLVSFHGSKSMASLCESRLGKRQRPHDVGWAFLPTEVQSCQTGSDQLQGGFSDVSCAVRMHEYCSPEIQPGQKLRDTFVKDEHVLL